MYGVIFLRSVDVISVRACVYDTLTETNNMIHTSIQCANEKRVRAFHIFILHVYICSLLLRFYCHWHTIKSNVFTLCVWYINEINYKLDFCARLSLSLANTFYFLYIYCCITFRRKQNLIEPLR